MSGAVDLNECPNRVGHCKCGMCAVCPYPKHMAIHGPLYGQPPGSRPYGHEFVPILSSEGITEDDITRARELIKRYGWDV